MIIDCPTIQYGRRVAAGNADYYDILSKSPDFPDEAEMLFRQRVCQSVQWTCGEKDGETYPDSFLFWKLPDARMLVAKLADAGCDSRGRPHALKIEALLIEISTVDMPVAEFLARLMRTPDWSVGTLSETPGETQFVENIESYIGSNTESLLLGSHPHFQAAGIDRICAPERPVRPYPPNIVSRSTNPLPEFTEANEWRCGSKTRIVLSILLLLCVGAIACQGYSLYSFHTELGLANRALENEKTLMADMETQLETERTQRDAVQSQLIETEGNLNKARIDHNQAKGTILRQEEILTDLQKQLTAARSNADAELRKANDKLTQDNQKYEEIIKKMHEGLSNLLSDNVQNLLNDIQSLRTLLVEIQSPSNNLPVEE